MANGQNHWTRQKREIDSYNIFYSSFHGTATGRTLTDLGYTSPIRFPEIPRRGEQKDAEPDFVTFNGSTLFQVEVKSGSSISNRVLRQMERCASVTIEDGQEYLRNSDHISQFGFDHHDLENIETAIVFMKHAYVNDIRPHNTDELTELEAVCAVLTQARGQMLQIERGSLGDPDLDSVLSNGIPLPSVPPTAVFLNEGVEKESLAVSLCLDFVIPDLKHGEVTLRTTEIDDIYPKRAVSGDDINDVFQFLKVIGACEQVGRGEYRFTKGDQQKIFAVTDKVNQQRVDDYLEDLKGRQASVHEF